MCAAVCLKASEGAHRSHFAWRLHGLGVAILHIFVTSFHICHLTVGSGSMLHMLPSLQQGHTSVRSREKNEYLETNHDQAKKN